MHRLICHAEGDVELVLDSGRRLNALTAEDWAQCLLLVGDAHADGSARRLIVRGDSEAFCAGAELNYLGELTRMGDAERMASLGVGSEFVRALIRFPLPTVALVHGPCYGIGASLALACDEVYVTAGARVGLVFARLGVPAGDMAASWLVARRLGTRRAFGLLSEAAVVSGQNAVELGLVDGVIAEAALSAAPRPPVVGPGAMRTTKVQILRMEGAYEELDALMDQQLCELVAAVGGAEFAEGLRAVQEKRDPHF